MRETAQFIAESISGSIIPKIALAVFAATLLATAGIAGAQHYYQWANQATPKPLASISAGTLGLVAGSTGTGAAFLITLYVADRNYRLSREHIPHLNLTLSVRRTPIHTTRDALFISLTAHNNSTTLCNVHLIRWTVHVVSPYTPDQLNTLEEEFIQDRSEIDDPEFPWHVAIYDLIGYNTGVEPGQSVQFVYQSPVHRTARAITASAFVYNDNPSNNVPGWYVKSLLVRPTRAP